MSDEWLTEVEALAVITIRTGIADPAGLLDDAVKLGRVSVDEDKPRPEFKGEIRNELNIYPGGFTAIDAEYDDRFRGALRSPRLFHRAELNAWILRLTEGDAKSEISERGRPFKQADARAAYYDIYGPEGHKVTKDQWVHVENKVSQRIGYRVSAKTIQTALKSIGK